MHFSCVASFNTFTFRSRHPIPGHEIHSSSKIFSAINCSFQRNISEIIFLFDFILCIIKAQRGVERPSLSPWSILRMFTHNHPKWFLLTISLRCLFFALHFSSNLSTSRTDPNQSKCKPQRRRGLQRKNGTVHRYRSRCKPLHNADVANLRMRSLCHISFLHTWLAMNKSSLSSLLSVVTRQTSPSNSKEISCKNILGDSQV